MRGPRNGEFTPKRRTLAPVLGVDDGDARVLALLCAVERATECDLPTVLVHRDISDSKAGPVESTTRGKAHDGQWMICSSGYGDAGCGEAKLSLDGRDVMLQA